MKIILFSRPLAFAHKEQIVQIFAAIERYGFDYAVNCEVADDIEKFIERTITPEKRYSQSIGIHDGEAVMVCYGGDGTLLEGVHRLCGENIPVVGINSGRLGFLALAQSGEIDEVFEQIASHALRIEQRSMIEVTGEFEGSQQSVYALNEVAVQRLGATMISVDIMVDNMPTLTCNGDGVIISTPTGSTAYSLSAGGPILTPSCHCFVLTPLSPHNLTLRPVVIPDSSTVELKIHTRSNEASISVDNRTFAIGDDKSIVIKMAKRSISLAVPHNISFYDSLRNKLMWGVDNR
ncbi:MAG: NAD(+)/NADH kinase [Alistipes sp.]|nr:NADH kinase [Rikenellaceae bacterium]MBQ8853581.1 NAD(+)/NADH kinase [Alistipes sp.]